MSVEISQALKDAIVQQAAERAQALRISLWPNGKRREGKNDSQFTGRVTLNTLAVGEMLATAVKDGKPEIELWVDVWQNEPSVAPNGNARPLLSGGGRTQVGAKPAAVA